MANKWEITFRGFYEGRVPADAIKDAISAILRGGMPCDFKRMDLDEPARPVPSDLVEGCARHALISAAPSVAIWKDDNRAAQGLDPWRWRVNGVVDDYAPTYAKAARAAQQFCPEAKKESSL